jgi:hypothetical protein
MTTITPPFTGSYAATLQGLNVSRFDLFGVSIAPKVGRSGVKTFLSSSSGVTDISPSATTFFNDSVIKEAKVTKADAVATATVEIITDDDYRFQQVPSYQLSQQTFGIEKLFESNTPFSEMNSLDPVQYIRSPDQVAWPVVMDVPGTLDPFDYAGAIEPIAIRSVIGGFSTFLGTDDNPEPTGVRAAVSSAEIQQNRKSRGVHTNNFYSNGVSTPEYFEEVGVAPEFEVMPGSGVLTDIPFESSYEMPIDPLVDSDPVIDVFYNVSNKEVRESLERTYTKLQLEDGFPGTGYKSAPCGYIYENSRGIDSIAYGGLLK